MSSIVKAGSIAGGLVLGSSVSLGYKMATTTVHADDKAASKMVKVSDLPIYDDTKDLYDVKYYVSEKSELEKGISTARKEVVEAVAATKEFRDQAHHVYDTGKAHTAEQINYLLDRENVGGRYGAIAIGGFVGLLLGARRKGRLFKKLFYTAAGAGGVTAALHPKESQEIGDMLINDANTYANVAYNFVFGVKPQSTSVPAAPKIAEPPEKKLQKRQESDSKKPSDQSNPADADMYTTRTA